MIGIFNIIIISFSLSKIPWNLVLPYTLQKKGRLLVQQNYDHNSYTEL